MNVNSSSDGIPAATVRLRVDGAEITDHASGDGAVDACYKVITKITGSQSQLVRYTVNAITGGADAQGEVSCVIEDDGIRVSGQGAHTDIIMASALAYINGLNKLEGRKHYRQVVEKEGPWVTKSRYCPVTASDPRWCTRASRFSSRSQRFTSSASNWKKASSAAHPSTPMVNHSPIRFSN